MANLYIKHVQIRQLGKNPNLLDVEAERIADFGENCEQKLSKSIPMLEALVRIPSMKIFQDKCLVS